ncbi:UNVERIFIED_CONTAM: hypothetical protein PYX00_003344 [Menopon gallinae]|uniref:Protein arginine methyltransferase NDUFAF7 n=1 Tax=Menopon gallinae TaxID=328185 RepID=A0AAW2I000_9NEOP
MKLFQWMVIRRLSCYKQVQRPKDYKVVKPASVEKSSVPQLLDAKIKASGPITVADFMKMVLTNPLTGYYMKRDVFGRKGDFITSPEISQMFGEIIGVWIYYELRKIGMPKPWQLIELGPGRGTMTKDILRVLKHFKALEDFSIHFVEMSNHLSSIQAQVLCDDVVTFGMMPPDNKGNPYYRASKTIDGLPIYWYQSVTNVPRGFSVVLAHEFFDALPIHKYQKVDNEWREVLINSRKGEKGEVEFHYTTSKSQPPLSKLLIREDEKRDHLEISPESGQITKYIADLLEEEGGFSLFIDYGHEGTKTDTFRGFKNHALHDPLVDPGSADLTADVDFSYLKTILEHNLLVFGPVEQGDFLTRMGIKQRMDRLMQRIEDDAVKEQLKSSYQMLVDKSQMGERYKCMAAFPRVLKSHLEKYPVAGFTA